MLSEVSISKIKSAFESLGMSEDHCKVYLACLKLQGAGASTISKETNLPRSSTYDILDLLSKKGLIILGDESGRKTFKANDPKLILELFNHKLKILNTNFQDFKDIFEDLSSLFVDKSKNSSTIQVINEEDQLNNFFNDLLNSKDVLRICSFDKLEFKTLNSFKDFFDNLIYKNISTKYLDFSLKKVDKFIYNNKIAYVYYEENKVLLIADEILFEYEKRIFSNIE